ncbi:MAG TPA: HipA domain-containing protein [Candidatus Sulfotelmatobacter sp.]|nr:HipA domain-containing protein [Candidatus Sulfotelmatobacter sp.]
MDDLEFTATTVGDLDPQSTQATEILERIRTEDAEVPRKLKRIAARSTKWGIPRSFVGYRADPTVQTIGYAPKWVFVAEQGGPEYIVKRPTYKGGTTETLTELLINQLGSGYGFQMAHSGLVSIDGRPAFVTRSFLGAKEHLVHGSLLIEEHYGAKRGELDTVPHGIKEQEFYSLDFVIPTLEQYCGKAAESVVTRFVEMVLFDALIGSTDRHAQNWGVIRGSTTQGNYRFSPIFDTSRGLFWNLPDAKLAAISRDNNLLISHINRACPLMGPVRKGGTASKCNHFHFLANLLASFPHLKLPAVTKVPRDVGPVAASILGMFPFRGAFSKLRRNTILKLILLRADMVYKVLEAEGGVS